MTVYAVEIVNKIVWLTDPQTPFGNPKAKTKVFEYGGKDTASIGYIYTDKGPTFKSLPSHPLPNHERPWKPHPTPPRSQLGANFKSVQGTWFCSTCYRKTYTE